MNEVFSYGTDLLDYDTDDDEVEDGEAIRNGTDRLDH